MANYVTSEMITNLERLNNVLQPSVGLSVQNTSVFGLALELVTEQENLEKSATG